MDHWEMFDVGSDASEMNTVFDDPTYDELRWDLHQKLNDLRTYYDDTSGDD